MTDTMNLDQKSLEAAAKAGGVSVWSADKAIQSYLSTVSAGELVDIAKRVRTLRNAMHEWENESASALSVLDAAEWGLQKASAALSAQAAGWRDIDSAPKDRPIRLGCWASEKESDGTYKREWFSWDDEWYEPDECWLISEQGWSGSSEEPPYLATHWTEFPTPPQGEQR